MIIYQIKLPVEQDAEEFASFMRNEYFPAIHKGPTRVGQITNLVLLQDGNRNSSDFLLLINWNGLEERDFGLMIRIDDDPVNQKFQSFGVEIEHFGRYLEIATLNNNVK